MRLKQHRYRHRAHRSKSTTVRWRHWKKCSHIQQKSKQRPTNLLNMERSEKNSTNIDYSPRKCFVQLYLNNLRFVRKKFKHACPIIAIYEKNIFCIYILDIIFIVYIVIDAHKSIFNEICGSTCKKKMEVQRKIRKRIFDHFKKMNMRKTSRVTLKKRKIRLRTAAVAELHR